MWLPWQLPTLSPSIACPVAAPVPQRRSLDSRGPLSVSDLQGGIRQHAAFSQHDDAIANLFDHFQYVGDI